VTEDQNANFALVATPSTIFPAPSTWTIISHDVADDTEIRHSAGAIEIHFDDELATIPASNDTTIAFRRVQASEFDGSKPAYKNVVFAGDSSPVIPGDKVWDSEAVLGSVVSLGTLQLGATAYTNCMLTLSEFALNNNQGKSNWYITAEGLTSADTGATADSRPAPELIKGNGEFTVKHALNRDAAGIPVVGTSRLYTGYRALRKDVGADGNQLLVIEDVTQLEEDLGPISIENPLAFGLNVALQNVTTINVKAIGVDETTANSPYGTVSAYQKALEFLESEEVYALAPLTNEMGVIQIANQHCLDMSEPEQRKERIVYTNIPLPTEKPATLVTSGTALMSDEGGGKYNFTFDDTINIAAALAGKVTADGTVIDAAVGASYGAEDGFFMNREGDTFNYPIVKLVDANTVQIDTALEFMPGSGPGTAGNDDAYWHTSAPEDFAPTGEILTLKIRQAAINGATSAGRTEQCEALAAVATAFGSSRLRILQPEMVGATFGGTEVLVPGFYVCAAKAAQAGQQSPSQPFTNLPINGFTRPVGSSDTFSEKQMAIAAAGGIDWIIQDSPGQPLFSRHQLTTDTSTVENREDSIIRAVDAAAKIIRAAISPRIGRFNITRGYLNTLSMILSGVLNSIMANKILAKITLDSLLASTTNKDEVAVDVTATVFYPANRIKLRIFV
jgi:hypothetical protein